MLSDETIAAIATPPGEGGVGIIRISGEMALEIGSAVFQSVDGIRLIDRDANAFAYGSIRDKEGVQIDAGLALVMRAPKSFTGEDTVELQGHGGAVVLRRVLRRVLEAGARMAEPGEFSRRAFEWTYGSNASRRFI